MKKIILTSLALAMVGCGGGSDSSNTSAHPVSHLSIDVGSDFTLVPVTLTDGFNDKYNKGLYEICWTDATDIEACLPQFNLAEYLESPTPFNVTVYGDANFVVRAVEMPAKYANLVSVRGEHLYQFNNGELTFKIALSNQDFAGFVVRHNDAVAVTHVHLGTGDDAYELLTDDLGNHYGYKNVLAHPEDETLTVALAISNPVTATVKEPKVGKSYTFEINENPQTESGVSLEADFGDLDDVNGCIGDMCYGQPEHATDAFVGKAKGLGFNNYQIHQMCRAYSAAVSYSCYVDDISGHAMVSHVLYSISGGDISINTKQRISEIDLTSNTVRSIAKTDIVIPNQVTFDINHVSTTDMGHCVLKSSNGEIHALADANVSDSHTSKEYHFTGDCAFSNSDIDRATALRLMADYDFFEQESGNDVMVRDSDNPSDNRLINEDRKVTDADFYASENGNGYFDVIKMIIDKTWQ